MDRTVNDGRRSLVVRALSSATLLFAVALVVRLVAIRTSPIFLPDARDHLGFGYEAGRIARSLVQGRGYANAFLGVSGPTAWLGPMYPFIIADLFKLLGVYSAASGIAVLGVNSVFGALTCLVIRAVGRMTFGDSVGLIAAWIFAVLPWEIAWSSRWVWDTSLSTLLLMVVVLLTLRIDREARPVDWVAYGLLWGVIILTNGSLISLLPVSAGWLIVRGRAQGARPIIGALVLAAVIASPWWMRNWSTFHKFIPMRSNLGMELYLGNHEGADGLIMFWDHPMWNDDEMQRYRSLGEIQYIDEKSQIARTWIAAHPGEFVKLSLKRVLMFWAGAPDPQRGGRTSSGDSQTGLMFMLSGLAWIGAFMALRRRVYGAGLLIGVLAVYPLVYYVTHTHFRYRAPLEPIVLLTGVALVMFVFAGGGATVLARGQRMELAARE